MSSLGQRLLPAKLHEILQLDRFPINDFIRKTAYPLLKKDSLVLDAGSGRLPEQTLRPELLSYPIRLETLDMFPGEGVDFVGDITKTEFEDNRYDIILCSQVLEHVKKPDQVCQELFRILKPGGYAIVTAPQSAYLHNLPHHFFHFTKFGMTQMLEHAGFEMEQVKPQGGHFMMLAIHLHYTCRVLEQFATTPIRKALIWPILMLWRFFFGFLGKSLLIYLDHLMPFEGNTQGWNCLCKKPV